MGHSHASNDIEDFYPLSPLQHGMLFHSLYAPESGVYVEQVNCTLKGVLDFDAFASAWKHLIARHPVLRTAFVGLGLKDPVQVVHRRPSFAVNRLDWRDVPDDEQKGRLAEFLKDECRRSFDLAKAPLMRLWVIDRESSTYEFVWTYHHALLDGWSVTVVIQELFLVYESIVAHRRVALPASRPYREYIVWLKKQDQGLAEHYWRKTLSGFHAPTKLQVGLSSGHEVPEGVRYHEDEAVLEEDETIALQKYAKQNRLTVNTLVQGAWAMLLGHYSGMNDVVFGATVSGRPAELPGVETMVGLFINTLPVRVTLPSNISLIHWLQELQEHQAAQRQFEYAPLVLIHGWSEVPRDLPLFETIVVFENYPISDTLREMGGNLSVSNVGSVEMTNYPLTLVAGVGDKLLLRILSDCSCFEPPMVRQMLTHLSTLLRSFVASAGKRLADVPFLPDSERQQIIEEWNDTHTPLDPDLLVHQLIQERVAEVPNALAVTCGIHEVTYGSLNSRANQLAWHLRDLGVGPEVVVGIYLERSVESVVSALAILKAGGAFLPIDVGQPRERLVSILADARANIVLTLSSHLGELQIIGVAVVCLDTDAAAIACRSEEDPLCNATARNLAYVIFTSGSTGTPKGVMLQHSGLANLVQWHIRTYAVTRADRATLLAGTGFDASVWELFPYLAAGASVHVVDEETRITPAALIEWLGVKKITVTFLPTPLAESMLDLQWREDMSLRVLLTGGDILHAGPPVPLPCILVNHYGPTEGTVVTTAVVVSVSRRDGGPPPIGRPIANTCLFILDPDLHPVPLGVPGELYIGGIGLARGYANRPELTAELFIPDSLSGHRGERLYRSGDLARYLPDGTIEFLGRVDSQVKVRGFRIELGEIESVLMRDPTVKETLVVAHEDGSRGKILTAYVVPTKGVAVSPEELKEKALLSLPDYMVPASFVILDAFPLTEHGKIDRRALPSPIEFRQARISARSRPPRTPEEEIIAGIFCQVLGITHVSADDNFFELGGHSLLATQVLTRVSEAFKVQLPLRSLFEEPTVAALATNVAEASRAARGEVPPPISQVPRDAKLPLSFAQERLWFLDQLQPNTPLFNIPLCVRLTGALNKPALEKSLNEIIRRHETLRTRFYTIDGKAYQEIAPDCTLGIRWVDMREAQEDDMNRILRDEARHSFALDSAPLFRVSILELGDEEHVVFIVIHHIICDGWSMNVLLHEIAVLYCAFAAGETPSLPEIRIQYADFASWQRQWLQGDTLVSHLEYWRKKLEGIPSLLELPTDRQRPPVQSFEGAVEWFEISPELTESIKKFARGEGATLFMTLLAAFQALLSRYTGQEDFCVGTPVANRNCTEIEGLIGFFVNTLVIRADFSGEPTFKTLVRRVKESALDAFAHQDLPFEMVVDAVEPDRNISHTPIFQTMFVLQNAPVRTVEVPGMVLATVNTETGVSQFDLTLSMVDEGDMLRGTVEYNASLFDKTTIQRLASHFGRIVEGAVTWPDRVLATLSLLTDEEQQRAAKERDNGPILDHVDQCVHQVFEKKVSRLGEAIAVWADTQSLSYQKLNAKANQLANYLRKCGVGPEVVVGICIERSLEMVIGILGILKAGGAYLPLEPATPADRLSFMLKDAGSRIVLTSRREKVEFPSEVEKVVTLDGWDALANESPGDLNVTVDPLNAAYVIYTSGSTGRPKGVVVTHLNLVNFLRAREAYYGEPIGTFLLLSSCSFDSSIPGIFGTLCQGGTLLLPPPRIEQDLRALMELVLSHSVTHAVLLPSLYTIILEHATAEVMASLRVVIIGGEPCTAELVQRHYALLPGTPLYNEYGPTEGTVWCSVYKCLPGESGRIPIGRPPTNTQIVLLDARLQPVPTGVPGELHIGGRGLARGYFRRPDLTAQQFIPDPFSDNPGARLYKTGDLARYRADGNIEFLGRIDHQVKLRGFRIELGEIEQVVAHHPDVRDVAVLVRDDNHREARLVAYVVPYEGHPCEMSVVRGFVEQRLPSYMIPAIFVRMDKFPLLPNGKLNRRLLPVPSWGTSEVTHAYIPPRSEREIVLADIWSQLLNVRPVGLNDNFFELGGDSILSIQMVARANKAGLGITPTMVFQQPTLGSLACAPVVAQDMHADQGDITGSVPLTPIQTWFFETANEKVNAHHWNTSMLVETWQPLDARKLEQALRHLMRHHDVLRLRCNQTEAGWEQVIGDVEEKVPFDQYTLATLSPEDQSTSITSIASQAQSSLNLIHGPLMRMIYFDLGEANHSRLLFIFHHLIFDGISWRIFLEDFQDVYHQLSISEQVRLSPKTSSVQTWSRALVAYAQSPQVQEEVNYWLSMAEQDPPHLPVDFDTEQNTYGSTEYVTLGLNPGETEALLHALPAAQGTQVNDVLLTGLVNAMSPWTGRRALWVEMEGHGRENIGVSVDVSRTIGWFTASFPVLLDLSAIGSVSEQLQAIKSQLRGIPNHGIGFGLLRYLSKDEGVRRRMKSIFRPQISFNYLGQFDQLPRDDWFPFQIAAESAGLEQDPQGMRSTLLDVVGIVTGGEMQFRWIYSRNVHARSTIERVAHQYLEELRATVLTAVDVLRQQQET